MARTTPWNTRPRAPAFRKVDRDASERHPPGAVTDGRLPPEAARRVLVVDDDAGSRQALERAFRSFGYVVEVAPDGVEALAKLHLGVDLVVLDAVMPNVDGFAVAQRIRTEYGALELPILMVTALGGPEDRLRAIQAGVNDVIVKPFVPAELELRSAGLLQLKAGQEATRRHRAELEATVQARTSALREALEQTAAAQRETYEAHLDTIRRLVLAAEYKDPDTAAHIERIGRYSAVVGSALRLPPGQVELLRHAAPMHDVGKIGIPDAILLKSGRLTPAEWEVMKQHSIIGARILSGSPSAVLQMGEVIARSHHERWDGKGYPFTLAGDRIPLEGRICGVVDVFDALTSHRPYRDALANETVYAMMEAERGHHFDPVVLDAFFASREPIKEIQAELAEGGADGPSAARGRAAGDLLWARVLALAPHGLRRGAWYRVLEWGDPETIVLDVHHEPVVVERGLVQLTTERPVVWSIVRQALGETTESAPYLGPFYGVCPTCMHRMPFEERQSALRCGRCHRIFPVDWGEAPLGDDGEQRRGTHPDRG